MTTQSLSWWRDTILPVGVFAVVVASFVAVVVWPWPNEDKAVVLCDKAVNALLNSKDLVEVTRAGIIIDQARCSVRRRL